MAVELRAEMQVATSDIYRSPKVPLVHIYVGGAEIGTLTLDGEVVDGDFGESFLAYTLDGLNKNYEVLKDDWDTFMKEEER